MDKTIIFSSKLEIEINYIDCIEDIIYINYSQNEIKIKKFKLLGKKSERNGNIFFKWDYQRIVKSTLLEFLASLSFLEIEKELKILEKSKSITYYRDVDDIDFSWDWTEDEKENLNIAQDRDNAILEKWDYNRGGVTLFFPSN